MILSFTPATVGFDGVNGVTLTLADVGVLVAIASTVMTLCTLLVRMFIKNAILDAVEVLRKEMSTGSAALRETLTIENAKTYARREMIDLEIVELKRRVDVLERRIQE